MTDVGCAAISILVMLIAFVMHPHRAKCPRGFWMNGVRPTGEFQCRRTPVGDDIRMPNGHVVDHSIQPPGVLDGRIFCAGGDPRVIDDTTVACHGGALARVPSSRR